MGFSLSSPSFQSRGDIPERHTVAGANVSPPLEWKEVPPETKSLALILEDPDAPDPQAPKKIFVHWVLYNLPPTSRGLREGIDRLPGDAQVGLNDLKQAGYSGPNPPIGKHRYVHRLFALDTVLDDLGDGATRKDLEKAMKGHVLAEAALIGLYANH
ncbi:MAG: YbhB/YbcL family Raf kinase inhibitor-like protein [Myxococcaceae bacterium]